MDSKYITFEQDDGLVYAIVFPGVLIHAEVAQVFGRLRARPISAGFVSVGTNADGEVRVNTYGESISLKLKSEVERDSKLVARALNLPAHW